MENNNIVTNKNTKKTDYFYMIICLITITLFIFQVAAHRHISKASRDFIQGERAKRIAAIEKQRVLIKEQELEAGRLAKQREEEEHLASMEARMKEANVLAPASKKPSGMDYRDKLEVFNKATAEAKAASSNIKAVKTERR